MNAWHPSDGHSLTQRELYKFYTKRLLMSDAPFFYFANGACIIVAESIKDAITAKEGLA
jgi:hypothetical protein